jgi:NAD(P)-dependent dehydrogenase (short-subunit alcohol dehydrogenase family)
MEQSQPVALVTGAARGIGHEVARQLAARGWLVLLSARRAEAAQEAARSLEEAARSAGGSVRPLTLDTTSPEGVARAMAAVEADPGRLDVLVNNAAAFVDWSETASTADLDAARAVMDTNLYGTWRVTQAALPLLRASAHPRVVVVGSGAG